MSLQAAGEFETINPPEEALINQALPMYDYKKKILPQFSLHCNACLYFAQIYDIVHHVIAHTVIL